MNNVNATVEGNTLVIKVDISPETIAKAPFSKSGKTKLVGSSGGFQKAGNVSFSVNVSSK